MCSVALKRIVHYSTLQSYPVCFCKFLVTEAQCDIFIYNIGKYFNIYIYVVIIVWIYDSYRPFVWLGKISFAMLYDAQRLNHIEVIFERRLYFQHLKDNINVNPSHIFFQLKF